MSLTLRHTLATVAYRGGKALRNAPVGFSSVSAGDESRTAGEILAHICDLFDWGTMMAQGQQVWAPQAPQSWEADCDRFFNGLAAFDRALESPVKGSETMLFQGPIADALTHIGQISLLRRLGGSPVRAENYARAEISIGRVGRDQTRPRAEF
jgi:hypothetical protein